MNAHLAVFASLGAVIVLSPEILLLGFLAASDRRVPRGAAATFAVGAAVGIGIWFVVGTLMAPASTTETGHHGWPAFWIRAGLAAALLVIGSVRAVNAFRQTPIEEEPKPAAEGEKPHGIHALLAKVLTTDGLPVPRRFFRAFLMGVVASGHSPKIFPVAMAAGHQLMQITPPVDRIPAVVAFASLAVIPGLVPLAVEMFRPGASAGLRDACERFMKRNSRMIIAVLLLSVGAFVAYEAWKDMPGHDAAGAEVAPAAEGDASGSAK
jgi:hypothetical protein